MFKKSLIAAAVVAASGAAFAASGAYQTHGGFQPSMYVGADLGLGGTSGSSSSDSNAGNTGLAFGANVGYQFHRNLAAELGWIHHSDHKVGSITVSYNMFQLAGKYIMPLQSNFSIYGLAGLGYVNSTVSGVPGDTGDNNGSMTVNVGGGVSYAMSAKLSLNAGLNYAFAFKKVSANFYAIMAGVSYKFN